MQFILENGDRILQFDALTTVGFALVMYLIGNLLKDRVYFFQRFCIPAPVIGGTLFAIVNLLFYMSGLLYFDLDTTYQPDMQNIFFTCMDFGISFSMLKRGGGYPH